MKSGEEGRAANAADRRSMWEVTKTAGIIIFLILCDIQDIREKRLSVKMLVLFGGLFFALSFLMDKTPYEQRIYSLMPGTVALFLAFLTKEQIGYGDAVCLMILGAVMTGGRILRAVMAGLFLASVCSLTLLLGKKANRKTTLPFLPFLTVGVLWQMIF